MLKKYKGLIRHKTYRTMFYVRYPTGELSKDFYSLSWAKEHLNGLREEDELRRLGKTPEDRS